MINHKEVVLYNQSFQRLSLSIRNSKNMKIKKAHLGKNISRIRLLQEMKQETVAKEMGISQQAISKIEQSSSINERTLQRLAKALNVTVLDIKEFKREKFLKNRDSSYSQNGSELKYILQLLCKLIDVTEEEKRSSESTLISKSKLAEILKKMN